MSTFQNIYVYALEERKSRVVCVICLLFPMFAFLTDFWFTCLACSTVSTILKAKTGFSYNKNFHALTTYGHL